MVRYKPSDLGLSNNSCYVISEIAQAHAYIDAIADAVKFQTHIAKSGSILVTSILIYKSKMEIKNFIGVA